MPYRIDYSPNAEDHLHALTARQQAMVLDAENRQLTQQPTVRTRNRKPMRPNRLAPWELRIGNLRIYNDVGQEPGAVVSVRAVGVKRGNRVEIGGEEIEL